ncbi:MAG: YceI family protein [Planctomycetaceae bacterium]
MTVWSVKFLQFACLLLLQMTCQALAAGGGLDKQGNVDLQASRGYVFVGKTGLGHDHGVEGRLKSCQVTLGAAAAAGRLEFNMQSFDADTDAARRYVGLKGSTDAGTRKQVNDNMKGSAVLDVQRHPTAVFEIESSQPVAVAGKGGTQGLPQYELAGKFTLHGRTAPLRIRVTAEEKDGRTHLRGSFTILQTAFGIRPYSKAFGAVGVADRLTIHGDVWLNAATTESR